MNPTEEDDRIEGLAQLRRDREPARDLWPGIEARLAPRRARNGLPLALAASLVAGFAGMFALRQPPPVAPPAGSVAVAPAAAPAPLSPDTRAIVKANLRLVGDAERQLQAALLEDPDSESLRSLLVATRQQQSELRNLLL